MPDPIKEKPRGENSSQTKDGLFQAEQAICFGAGRFDKFLQATGADDAVIMFGDAFAAEEEFALGTTRNGFTQRVVETTLLVELFHC